jgi:hypothetical protein
MCDVVDYGIIAGSIKVDSYTGRQAYIVVGNNSIVGVPDINSNLRAVCYYVVTDCA